MLFGETVAVYCENHMEYKNTLYGHNAEFSTLKRVVLTLHIYCASNFVLLILHFYLGNMNLY
jgi:hypothetical protein